MEHKFQLSNYPSQRCLSFVSFVTAKTTWLNNTLGCQLSKRSKQMYSIHFASPIPTTTHLVKHTIRDGRIIPTFHVSLLKDKNMVDHHHFKNHLLIINFTREINSIQHHLSLHKSLPIKENHLWGTLSNNSCSAN